jgi:hypothetical protein
MTDKQKGEAVNSLTQRLTDGMTAARDSADGQKLDGYITLPRNAYEKLYYAAYDAKKILVALKEVL